MPRIAVISDVSPEESVAGKRLLYRLLAPCEASGLTIVEGDIWPTEPARRLQGVPYRTIHYKSRYHDTRLHPLFSILNTLLVRRYTRELCEQVTAHNAEAILTVAHGHLWLVAAEVARACRLPLHLFVHDDWPGYTPVPRPFRGLLHHVFKKVYRQAVSRFCISEFMEAEYRKNYGLRGDILQPFRGPDSPSPRLRMRYRNSDDPLTVGFAGSIPNGGYLAQLREVAILLEDEGGYLDLYTNMPSSDSADNGLDRSNVRFRGFFSPFELADRLEKTVDVLFVPASFAPADATHMRTLFPSKLVEYTAIGIPILIWGPEYAAAVQWGLKHAGAVEVVTDPAPNSVAESLRRLANNPERARRMAEAALTLGEEQFGFEAALNAFQGGLLRTNGMSR